MHRTKRGAICGGGCSQENPPETSAAEPTGAARNALEHIGIYEKCPWGSAVARCINVACG
eukprot:2050101-Pyramimonas_sp.AAC.1